MIYITEAAQMHFAKLLTNQEPETQIRVFVINPGTPYIKGCVSYCSLNSVKTTDIEIKFNKFSAYIDKFSAPFLEKAEIDFVTNKLESQLIFKIPKIQKVTDNNSLAKRVKYVIQSQINPQLVNHGGKVSLIKISTDKYAVLKFSGNCKGCSMVNFTLKENIEKQLLNIFPDELKGVKDLTEHQIINNYF